MSEEQRYWTAGHLIKRLEERHANDQFAAEVQLGSAHAGCRRMDAWAMKRSWSPLTTHGYEVKVTRNDFMRDDKWPAYRPFVHHLWFACPHGLIQPEELPKGIGLLWLTKNGKMLRAKRKAARHDVELDKASKLWLYLLMTRSEMQASQYGLMALRPGPSREERIEEWRKKLEDHKDGKRIGLEVATRVREVIGAVQNENRMLKARVEAVEALSETLKANGIDPGSPWTVKDLSDKLGGVPKQYVKMVLADLDRTRERMRNWLGEERADGDG